MQHNACVTMQIIAFPLVLRQTDQQARPYLISIKAGAHIFTFDVCILIHYCMNGCCG